MRAGEAETNKQSLSVFGSFNHVKCRDEAPLAGNLVTACGWLPIASKEIGEYDELR